MKQGKQTGLTGKAFDAWRSQPRVWLWLSFAGLPWAFSNYLLSGGYRVNPLLNFALFLPAEILCFAIFFLSWCLAALAYGLEERSPLSDLFMLWRECLSGAKGYYTRLACRFWLFQYLYSMVFAIPFTLGLIPVFLYYGSEAPVFIFSSYAAYFIVNLLSALLIVRICLSPQLAILAGKDSEDRAGDTMRESVESVRQQYRRVLCMFLPVWAVGSAAHVLNGLAFYFFTKDSVLAVLSLLIAAGIEGGRMSFIMAGCNEYFKDVYS